MNTGELIMMSSPGEYFADSLRYAKKTHSDWMQSYYIEAGEIGLVVSKNKSGSLKIYFENVILDVPSHKIQTIKNLKEIN